MKIISFIREPMGLRPVEVEVSLTPGLPRIQFLGLPDALIKESVLRIQSALKHCGYKMPRAKQILIQLKPNYLKKSSQGLDLAVACAILWESKQEPKPDIESIALYGELSLKGEVFVPDDFQDLMEVPEVDRIMTGKNPKPQTFDLYAIEKLTDLKYPQFLKGEESLENFVRPELPNLKVSVEQATLLKIIAVGEHPCIFAGPPGTGKTTLAMLASLLLKNPDAATLKMSQKISRQFGIPLFWRPIVSPHHTSTALAMTGGGGTPRPGEITRAHGGVLILDEFLEFDQPVQEALREPMESGRITISRAGHVQIYPARFLLLATTNLCVCGYLIPDRHFVCQGRSRSCHSKVQKLSGPMMDRFPLLSFSHLWTSETKIPVKSVLEQIKKVQDFILQSRGQSLPNHYISGLEFESQIEDMLLNNLKIGFGDSHRRYHSFLKVARTLADIDFSEKISIEHIERARKISLEPFQVLRSF